MKYKSDEAETIADILSKNNIIFEYQFPFVVKKEEEKLSLWYADFWLPEYSTVIECIRDSFEESSKKVHKEDYLKLNIFCIPIYPKLHKESNKDIEKYILETIEKIINMKYIDIKKIKSEFKEE